MKTCLLFIAIIAFAFSGQGTPNRDSINYYLDLSKETGYKNLDEGNKFAQKALALSLEYAEYDLVFYSRVALINTSYNQHEVIFGLLKANDTLIGQHELYSLAPIQNYYWGNFYKQIGNNSYSAQFMMRSIMQLKNTTEYNALANSLDGLASIFYSEENYEKSLEYALKAIEVKTTYLDENGVAGNYNNVGRILEKTEDYDRAEVYYKKALTMNIETGNIHWQAYNYGNLGELYATMGKNELAKHNYTIALSLAREIELKNYEATLITDLGMVYLEAGQTDSAYYYMKYSEHLMNDAPNEAIIWNEFATNVEKQRGNYRAALDYSELLLKQKEIRWNQDVLVKMAEMELKYAFELKEKTLELANEKQISQLTKKNNSQLKLIVILLISLILLLGIVSFVLKRIRTSRIQTQELELHLNAKNREITLKTMEEVNRNKTVDHTLTALKRLKLKVKKTDQASVEDLMKALTGLKSTNIWRDFELIFTEVHPDFFERLSTYSPQLSPLERRLCAFLKMNLSSKEIAAITGISAKSVDVSRTRLRKKLQLTGKEISLPEFMQKI